MRLSGRRWPLCLIAFASAIPLGAVGLVTSPFPECDAGTAKTFAPCELHWDWQVGELPHDWSPTRDDILTVEFKSPHADTYLIHAYWDGGQALRARFSPVQPGVWTYRVSGSIKRFDGKEGTFPVAESGSPGFVGVANLRHWWTTNKQPHLWLAATAPVVQMTADQFRSWLDDRKRDGFTHVRGTALTAWPGGKPFTIESAPNAEPKPNLAYFRALDEKVAEIVQRGLAWDAVLADKTFLDSGTFDNWDQQQAVIKYVVARYGALDLTWQGIERFEEQPGSRGLLKEVGTLIGKLDPYHHPQSTDAVSTTTPLLADGWMNYLVEASSDPQVGAVEHQFTQQPMVHLIQSVEPNAFRHELWMSTTNGEYPTVKYEALQNAANIKTLQVWVKVMADTRHWELEPYFDVDNANTLGLDEVEYLAYADKPGTVEVTLPKHKYNPVWVNPITGDEEPLKNYRGEVFSQTTPDASHDWVLQVPRDGHKESMLRWVKFDSVDPPVQEPELDPAKVPFTVVAPAGDEIHVGQAIPFQVKLTRANRATRVMQYVWTGEVVAGGEGARIIGTGLKGTLRLDREMQQSAPANLSVRIMAINANGKAYELDRVYRLIP